MIIIQGSKADVKERSEHFRTYAERRQRGEVLAPPRLLPPLERRLHVRQTLREDHQFRIHNRPEGAQSKFDKLCDSPFKFFRGTALLYYRDYAGTDAELPIVFTIGDVHPENFGVMPNADGAPFFGLNDFDEAYFAPFSWDVKRGAVGFFLAAQQNGIKKKQRHKIVKRFVEGYLNGLKSFARDDRERWHQFRIDNSPEMIRELLESALEERTDFLGEKIELDKGRFKPTDEIVPYSSHVEEFQKAIKAYVKDNKISKETRAGHFEVKDVAVKKGSGTASLGLDRYWVLIDGQTDDHKDDILLEMKQARRSALHGLVPSLEESGFIQSPKGNKKKGDEGKAERVALSQTIHVVGGDPYYGHAKIDDTSFIVRERSPFKDDIDIDDLSKSKWKEYASICGLVLAQAHARSDEDTGVMEGDAEALILSSVSESLFTSDVVRFAEAATKRICADYETFIEDHKLGAFQFVGHEE